MPLDTTNFVTIGGTIVTTCILLSKVVKHIKFDITFK